MNTDYEIKKIKHLNLVLRAFRDVGRLLVTENDKRKLINGICNILVETRGYYNAWIGLIDKKHNIQMVAEAGFNSQFVKMRKHLEQKEFTRCIEKTFESEDVFSVADPVKECPDCLLSKNYSGRGSMAARLTHESKNYGFLVLSVPRELSIDDTEKSIVKEIADDIAFGLYRMDLEVKRKEAEKEQQESQIRFETLIKNSLNCIAIFQDDKKIYGNAGLRKIHHQIINAFEPPEFKNVYIEDLPGIRGIYDDLVSDKIKQIDTDFRYYPQGKEKEDSQLRWASVRARKIDYLGKESIIANLMDITDSKEVETFLRIQDKMTSLGRVTAGIAHEIRNPLSGIYIYLKALKKIYKNMGDVNSVLGIIDKVNLAADKIESIIKRVMDFSRPASPQLIMTDINKNIDEVTKLTSVSLRKSGIKFIKELDPDIPNCWNEPLLIEQVVLNLITNAAEAMKDFDGEKIIRLKTFAKKDTVTICVEDSGPGIPLPSHSKIFDPFFTTKTNSSGIGLSICHRIITDHGGALKFNPGTPNGARFIIELPINKNGKPS